MRTGISTNSRYTPLTPATPSPARQSPTPVVGGSAWQTEAAKWIGAPYHMGGETRRGVDCSGLVCKMYESVSRIQLPRTTAEQSRTGSAVMQNQLRPGDILFFATPTQKNNNNAINHSGIYLGDGRFVHATVGKGVIYSMLAEKYYATSYRTARRILR